MPEIIKKLPPSDLNNLFIRYILKSHSFILRVFLTLQRTHNSPHFLFTESKSKYITVPVKIVKFVVTRLF